MATFKDYVEQAAADLTSRRLALLERLRLIAIMSPVFIGAAGYFVARTNRSDVGQWTAWSLALLMVFGFLAAVTLTALRNLRINAAGARAAIIPSLALGALMTVAASAVAIGTAPVAAVGLLAIVAGLYVLGIRLYLKVTLMLLPQDRRP